MAFAGLIEGRVVHYVLNDGVSRGEHRPAVVVRVWRNADGLPQSNGICQLQVLTDDANDGLPAVVWRTSVLYDAGGRGTPPPEGTWHWIEQA